MAKQPHELDFNDHEAGLNSGLANCLRLVGGNGKVRLMPDELKDAQSLLDTIRVSLAGNPATVAALVGIRHHLLKQQRAEAEATPPAPEAA